VGPLIDAQAFENMQSALAQSRARNQKFGRMAKQTFAEKLKRREW
jgi:hypothetical protein